MIKRILLAVLVLSLITPAAVLPSHSATNSPAPTKKPTVTKKPTAKPTVTKKPTAKPTVTKKPTAKPTVTKKPTAKPKVKKKPKPKATSKVAPLPTPVWPPKGYKVSSNGSTFAKIPTLDALKGLSNIDAVLEKSLAVQEDGVRVCEKYACGAIQVASTVGCTYWIVTADVRNQVSATDKTLKVLGQLRTTYTKTGPKQFATILLVSKELLDPLHSIGNFKADCRSDIPVETVPTTTYTSNS
ncbi:unannotated protein [freshwater metagenome]|uniref:Unannotated protein n=1 Tax=freshwater metagenome TaxID=449393 RepID=A0A6J6KUS5_9ZZZZ